MYLYFDVNGNLKEIINYPVRELADNVNVIYIYVEPSTPGQTEINVSSYTFEDTPDTATVKAYLLTTAFTTFYANFKVADSDTTINLIPVGSAIGTNAVVKEIPFSKDRDLKYFEYYKYYQFIKITLTSSLTNYSGRIDASVNLVNTSPARNMPLDVFSFYIQSSVVIRDVEITAAQYAYLYARIEDLVRTVGENIVVAPTTSSIVTSDYSDGQLFYVVGSAQYYKIDNGSLVLAEDVGLLGSKGAIARYKMTTTKTVAEMYSIFGSKYFVLEVNGGFNYLYSIFYDEFGTGNYNLTVFSIEGKCIYYKPNALGTSIIQDAMTSQYKITYVEHRNQSGNNAYVNVGGTDTLMKVSSNAEGGIMSRNSSGQTKVGDPTDDAHAANKGYVDDNFVPYTGATGDVNLGNHDLTCDELLTENIYANNDLDISSDEDIAIIADGTARLSGGDVTISSESEITILADDGVTINGDYVATEDFVYDQIQALGTVFNYKGAKTVAQLNALSSGSKTPGDVYNVTDSGTLTAGSVVVTAGDNVVWNGTSWDRLAGDYVPSARTVAGIALSSNISTQSLTDALVFASNSDIDNMF